MAEASTIIATPKSAYRERQPTITAAFLMVFFGCIVLVRRGETFQNAMVSTAQSKRRFYRWRSEGLWQRMWENLMQQADTEGNIDWEVSFVDSTIVRAHQHAAGAKGGNQKFRLWDVALVALALKYT